MKSIFTDSQIKFLTSRKIRPGYNIELEPNHIDGHPNNVIKELHKAMVILGPVHSPHAVARIVCVSEGLATTRVTIVLEDDVLSLDHIDIPVHVLGKRCRMDFWLLVILFTVPFILWNLFTGKYFKW